MVATLQSVKVLSVNVRAVLVTGSNHNGTEYAYSKSSDGWADYFNECEVDADFVQKNVFPNVQYVRYPINSKLEYKMSRAEWIDNGCPLDLPKSVVEQMIETEPHPVDFTQVVERKIDEKLGKCMVVSATPVKVTVSRSWAERHLNVDVNGFTAELDKAFGEGNWVLR